jgi:hypothetical protein
MKTVKFLSMTLLMSMFCVGMAFAQPQQGQHNNQVRNKNQKTNVTPEQRASKQVEAMKKSLNLSSDQVSRLEQVYKEEGQSMSKGKGNQQNMQARREAIDSKVKSILTPEQYQKYQDMHKNGKSGSKQGKGNKNGNWDKNKKDDQSKKDNQHK